MSPTETAAVIGVAGTLLAGISGLAIGAVFQARRDKLARARATRVARHLVENELEVKLFALEGLRNKGRHWEPALDDLVAQMQWERYGGQLADRADESWDLISQPYQLSRGLVAKQDGMTEDVFFGQVERLREILLAALQELRPGYVDPYPFREIQGLPPMPANRRSSPTRADSRALTGRDAAASPAATRSKRASP